MASPERRAEDEEIELPVPTMWPLIAAFGLALSFAGLVTHVIVTMLGVTCFVVAAVGWWREVLPVEKEERVALVPLAARARPIAVSPGLVEYLEPGEAKHRMRIPTEIHPYSSGLLGGLAGGVAMAGIALLYGLITHGSVWYPVNLLAAAALPSLSGATLPELEAYNTSGLLMGALIHVVMSLFVGLLYAVILPMFAAHPAIWGGFLAPILWTGLVWASLGIVNPVLNTFIDWWWFAASQLAFGLVAGFVVHRTERIATMQALPLTVRAGVESLRREDGE